MFMRKILIIIGFFTAILATILSVTPLYNIAVIPIIIAFISGLLIYMLSKKLRSKTKSIQYIFLLVIIALSTTIYKNVFTTAELGDVEALEQLEEKNLEDSKQQLEGLEIDVDL